MKFPRLSNLLALAAILAAALYSYQLGGWVLALFVLITLLQRTPSSRLDLFDNTADAALTVAKVMDTVLTAFVSEILPITGFSTQILPRLQTLNELGTATVYVPFIPIQTNQVRDFDASNGDCYQRGGRQLNKVGVNINRRKYLPWTLTSWQNAVTPSLASVNGRELFGRLLAQAVLGDIMSVITAANYPNSIAVGNAGGFDTNVAFDVRQALTLLKFPKAGRSMILRENYDTALLKDNKDANIYGATTPRWEARIPRIAGMDEMGTTAFDTNADVTAGIVAFPSALLVAMAPLDPLPSVKQKLIDFQIFTHQESGITLVYKKMADEFCDEETELVECTYGFGPGQSEALARLTTA